MTSQRRTPEDWHSLGQFCTQIAFAICLVGAVFGVLYSLVFVTQPVTTQAPNDLVLFEILKHVLTSMISIVGTLMAVGHGSNASAPVLPKLPTTPPIAPVATQASSWVKNSPKPPSKPVDDDEPPFKGARE
ncbi:hypothetical protein UFOVP259_31 [uncultured Caudovirales phage]|uniref:Uncharacterized protein n=1 Tax=uncultured Caudovirales phage TaxID=2100421 RepID=A0A6J5LGJ2_9CAUD|nr:hypothetical protein UFOVP259_31 [uncultured Caudovirales phage]